MKVSGGRIEHARVALGGVGTRPWRSPEAEHALEGQPVSKDTFRAAADEAMKEAQPQSGNGFKVELAKRCIVRALAMATATKSA
jgi:xanthine dehydrogenase YagS FAD-binding subunit